MEWRKSIWIILIFIIFAASAVAAGANNPSQKNETPTAQVPATAENNTGKDVVPWGEIFPWYSGPSDWLKGILLALSGLMGALITIYSLIGTTMPGTSGEVSLEAEGYRLESFKKKLSELWEKEENDINIEAAKELETTTTNLQAYISKERWRQFGLAALLYVILGAFFAALLTESFLQGLVIGAGWTAYLGVVGLKKDGEVRGSIKDREIDELVSNVKERDESIKILKNTLKETSKSIDKISEESKKKTRVLYAPKGYEDGELKLFEGTKELGPWYYPGQFNPETLGKLERQKKIEYTEI